MMAENRFAAMLQRNKTHKITVVLIYTFLEWTLIALLFVNAIFSYFISIYVSYFGLRSPCVLCSRLELLFNRHRSSFSDDVCNYHFDQIVELGVGSSRHRKGKLSLKKAEAMPTRCLKCGLGGSDFGDLMAKVPIWKGIQGKDLTLEGKDEHLGKEDRGVLVVNCGIWKDKNGIAHRVEENEKVEKMVVEVNARAQLALEEEEEDTEENEVEEEEEKDTEENEVEEEDEDEDENEDEDDGEEEEEEEDSSSSSCSSSLEDEDEDEVEDEGDQETRKEMQADRMQRGSVKVESTYPLTKVDMNSSRSHVRDVKVQMSWEEMLRFFKNVAKDDDNSRPRGFMVEIEDGRFYPTTSGDSFLVTPANTNSGDDPSNLELRKEVVSVADDKIDDIIGHLPETLSDAWNQFQCIHQDIVSDISDSEFTPIIEVLEIAAVDETNGGLSEEKATGFGDTKIGESCEQEIIISEETDFDDKPKDSREDCKIRESVSQVCNESLHEAAQDSESNCEVSIGSEICEQDHIDLADNHEPLVVENFQSLTGHHSQVMSAVDQTPSCELPVLLEHDDNYNMNRRFTLDRKESVVESICGNAADENNSFENMTVYDLKSALKAERKALAALYSDLEEERSASDIAARQTMAMITRLQEEKATVQMEALQYQRMMEEQCEYDQDALQILDELAKKREKEKQEALKELEVYRRKVHIFEAKEKKRLKKEEADEDESVNESDSPSLELNQGDDEFGNDTTVNLCINSGKQQGSAKYLGPLTELIAEFDEERISSLDQLNSLEKKLSALDSRGELPESQPSNNLTNGQTEVASERERFAIAEEMDNVYQRLEAIEEDRIFLKHCVSSLKKGDKEIDLLYEILQHFRSLRNVELRVRDES